MKFDNFCERYEFISTEHKKSLELNISKKGYLHGEKRVWPNFPRFIEHDRSQATFY